MHAVSITGIVLSQREFHALCGLLNVSPSGGHIHTTGQVLGCRQRKPDREALQDLKIKGFIRSYPAGMGAARYEATREAIELLVMRYPQITVDPLLRLKPSAELCAESSRTRRWLDMFKLLRN